MDLECQTMSVEEAAKILGISRNLAYAAVKTAKLPAIRFGRKIRVPDAVVERLLDDPTPPDSVP